MADTIKASVIRREDFESACDAAAQALADGHTGCSGGCAHRPCDPDIKDGEMIGRRVCEALGFEVPDGW